MCQKINIFCKRITPSIIKFIHYNICKTNKYHYIKFKFIFIINYFLEIFEIKIKFLTICPHINIKKFIIIKYNNQT